MSSQQHVIDSVVLVIIDKLNQKPEPFGLRALVTHCQLADKTISKAIRRLEQSNRLRVFRREPGVRHEYIVLDPPTQTDKVTAAIHLGQTLPWTKKA